MHLIFNEKKLFLICYGYSQGLELWLNAASVAVNCDRLTIVCQDCGWFRCTGYCIVVFI